MKKSSKLLAFALAGVAMLSLTACGSAGQASKESQGATASQPAEMAAETTAVAQQSGDGKEYKIGVLQLVQHAALDASNQGFIKALDDA